MMHESCLVRKKNGQLKMLAVGGKVGTDQVTCGYTDSVISYDMKYVFDPYLKKKDDPENKFETTWETNKNMNNARANFALIVLDNLIYVFGGIKSKGKGKSSHVPSTVDIITERYDINTDSWENI